MKKFFRWILIPLSLAILLSVSGCYPALSVSVRDDIGFFQNTNITVINTTPYTFNVLVDGRKVGTICDYGKFSVSLWSGSYYGTEVAISITAKNFAHTEKVWVCSSAYSGRYSHVFTIRQDEYRGLWVERN